MADTDTLTIPPDRLRAALEARRQRLRGLNASPEAVSLDQKLAQLRTMRNTGILAANRAAPDVLGQPQPAEATATLPPTPPGAQPVRPADERGLLERLTTPAPAPSRPSIGGQPDAERRLAAAADRAAAAEVSAGRVRALVPGAAPAAYVERAVGRAVSHLPGAAGEYGQRLATMGETHQREEAAGAETLPFLAKLPADIANLMLELEVGGRIPGPVGRTIGQGYREPVLGNLAGELAAPGLAATVGRVMRMGGREAGRFATLEAVKGVGAQDPAEQVIVQALAGGAGGFAWGAGSQVAREALARAVAAGLRGRMGPTVATEPAPREVITSGRVVAPEEPPPGVPPAAPDAPNPPAPAAPAAAAEPVNVEAFAQEIAGGKYTDRELKTLRATFLAKAGTAMRPPNDPVTRIIDAIDAHFSAKGEAGAAPIEPSAPTGAEARPGEALHDAEGNVIPGTEVTPAMQERRAAAGGPPAGTTERRARVPIFPERPLQRRTPPGGVRPEPAAPTPAGAAERPAPPSTPGRPDLEGFMGTGPETITPEKLAATRILGRPEPGFKAPERSTVSPEGVVKPGALETPDRKANVERFVRVWEPHFRAAAAAKPEQYGNPTPAQMDQTVAKMRKAFLEGTYASSPTINRALRQLGLKETRQALANFLSGPAQPEGGHTEIRVSLRDRTVTERHVPAEPFDAAAAGKRAFEAGIKAAPRLDPAMHGHLTAPEMDAWSRAWHEANVAAPVPGSEAAAPTSELRGPKTPGNAPAVSPPAGQIPPATVATPTRTVQPTAEEANQPASEQDLDKLVDAATRLLKYEGSPTGAPFPRDPKAVRVWAEKVLGRPYSSGSWTTDDAYDAIEVAANLRAHEMLGPVKWGHRDDVVSRLRTAREIEEKIFGTRTRTEAMVAQQQFSTPLPIAEAAAYATDVLPDEKVLEPTAGTGNLATPLLGTGAKLTVNELDARRAALLRILRVGHPDVTVTSEDALGLFLSGKRYNAIVMNPPFGGYNLGKYSGQGATQFAASDVSQRFVAAALRSLADNGRLVAVMPEGMLGKTASAFRAWLRANYQVTAMIEAPEGSYATRGTKFGTWLLVVDKTGPHIGNTLEVAHPTWEQWYDSVAMLGRPERRGRPRTAGHEPAQDVAAAARTGATEAAPIRPAALKAPGGVAPAPLSTPSSAVADAAQQMADAVKDAVRQVVEEVRHERPAAVEPSPSQPPRSVGGGPGEAPAGGVGGERGAGPRGPVAEPGGGVPPEPGRGAGVVAAEGPAQPGAAEAGPAQGVVPRLARRRVEPGRLDSPERRAELQAANDSPVFTPYERGTAVERNPHPRLVVETRSQAGMPAPAPHVTTFQSPLVQAAWGRSGAKGGLSDDQADMVLRVMSAWDRGHGFVIADDVGVGKSREAAAIILEAIARGDQRILYTTKNETNLVDVQRELNLVATGDPEGHFPATYVLGQDYPKAASRSGRQRTESLPTPAGATVYLVHSYNFEPLADSLHDVAPTVWVGDEAHEYKNGYSKRGMAWQRLHTQMLDQRAKFVYLTATPAVTLDELGYLYGLKEWVPGGFPDWIARRLGKSEEDSNDRQGTEAVEAQQAADTALGEASGIATPGSTDLAPGKKPPFRREALDAFSGRITPAETEQVMRELKGMGKFLARDLWRGGVEFTVHTLDLLGDAPAAVAARARYDQAAELVRDITMSARKFGYLNQETKTTGLERAMIQSYMKQLLFDLRLPEILRLADASLKQGRQVVISVHTVTGDADAEEGLNEDVVQVPLNKRLESAINRINTREVKKSGTGDDVQFEDLGEIPEALAKRAELLDKLRALPPLKDPVRAFEDHFGAKNIAIITGQVTPQNRTKQMGEFQAGKRHVAMISKAGKIGISLHDVNGAQRHLIVGDYEWSADTFKQELGRVDRTGQKSKPVITLVASNVGGERKFASTIAARMATLGATSKGAAEATGTDALDQFEATGDLPVAAMKNAVEKMDDHLRQYFTGSKYVEAKEGYRGERVFKAKRRPDEGDMRSFLLEMLMFPVKEAHQALDLWVAEREALMTGEATAAAESRKTGKLTGRILRTTDLTTAPAPTLTMHEVQNDAGEHKAILQGFVTQHIDKVQAARGHDEMGRQRPRRYVSFHDTGSGEMVSGLEVAPAEARRIKGLFGIEQRFLTPADAYADLQAGDAVKVQGDEGAAWTLHPRRDGRVQIQGATLSKHRDVLRNYALYEAVGNYLYVKGGDTPEGVARFLERFPIRQAAVSNPPPAVPPEPSAARYERLGKIMQSPMGLKLRELLRDRLIEAGNDQAEVEALDDRGLINRTMEQEVLTPEEESKLLDGLLGERGALRLSRRGRARMAAPPEVPARTMADSLHRRFNPASRTTGSTEAEAVIRARFGERAREDLMVDAQLDTIRKGFPALDTPEGIEFADRMETGQPVDPNLEPSAALIRAELDAARERVRELGIGRLEHFIADYLPHLWEKPDEARSIIAKIMGRRPLQGPKSFLKHRTIPTIADGIEAGLKPVTTNLLDMVALKVREMNKFVMGQRIMQDLRKQGLVRFVRAGKKPPAGYLRIHDSIATVYGKFTAEGAMTVRGEFYAPEPVATLLNNHLSAGLRGDPIFDAYMWVGNTLNQVQLGLSAFHLGFVSMDSIVSQVALGLEQIASGVRHLQPGRVARGLTNIATQWTAPFSTFLTGNKVIQEYTRPGSVGGEFVALADAVTKGGGRVRMDTFYTNNAVQKFVEAIRKGRVGAAALQALPSAMEFAAKPLMEVFVPRMKMGVFAQMARFELERLPHDATVDQVRAVMAKVWDSVDNRMGQVVYDNLFWDRTLKDLAMASVRSVGWNLGTLRELGGGTADILRGRGSHRAAYTLALPFAVGLLGALTMYLLTGHGPETLQDYYQPRTGRKDADGNDERVQPPSYMKDVIGALGHGVKGFVTTIAHKLHPLPDAIISMLNNEDYWGGQIRNPNDPPVEQFHQLARYIGSLFTPIGIRNVTEQKHRMQTGGRSLLPMVGVTPAPRADVRSPAQNLMAEYLKQGAPSGGTPEEAAQRHLRNDVADQFHRREITYGQARAALRAGGLSDAQVQEAARTMLAPPTLTRFKQLTLEQARAVYDLGTPEEKRTWGPALFSKVAKAHPRTPPKPPAVPRRR